MTTIEVSRKIIHVYGHSGYGTYGNDIVCAAISTLVETTYFYLKATKNDVTNSEKDGEYTIFLNKININGNRIINSFKEIVDELIKQYPAYLRRIEC